MPISDHVGATDRSEIDWSPSPGIHSAVIREVADGGVSDKYGKEDHRGILVFQILDEDVEFDDGNKRAKNMSVWFSISSGLGSTKAKDNVTKLRKILQGIRGKVYTTEEILRYVPKPSGGGEDFAKVLNSLEGKAFCKIVVKDNAEGKRIISDYSPWPKTEAKPALPPYETIAEREARKSKGGGYGGGRPAGGHDDLDTMTGQAPPDDDIPF